MKIKEITFEQLIQVRQYEPCKISATAIINEGESVEAATNELKNFVQGELKKVYQQANKKEATPSTGGM